MNITYRLGRDRFHNRTYEDWVNDMLLVVENDVTSCHVFIVGLREGFDIRGAQLEDTVCDCIARIAASGARPLKFHSDEGGWTRLPEFGDDPAVIAASVIAAWRAIGTDPGMGDICYFAMPDDIAMLCQH